MSKNFKIAILCLLVGPFWLGSLLVVFAPNPSPTAKAVAAVIVAALSGIGFFVVRKIRKSSDPAVPVSAVSKGFNSAQLGQVIGGLVLGGFILWHFQGGSAGIGGGHSHTIMNCGEPIVIEACDTSDLFPSCRIRNLARAPLGTIAAWGYDAQGVRLGSPVGLAATDGLSPQQVVKTDIVVEDLDKASTIVLCSVDPQSSLGSGRFGIGQQPPMTH